MDVRLVLGLAMLCACNAKLSDGPSTDASTDGSSRDGHTFLDAGGDAALGAWGTPSAVTGASDPTLSTDDETLSSTQTEMYFGIVDTALPGSPKQLWMMTRASPAAAWGTPTKLGASFNVGGTTPPSEESPRLSPDDLTIYFGRAGNIYSATRGSVGGTWSTPTMLPATINNGNYAKWLAACNGGHYMVSRANTPNGQDFYQGTLGGAAPTLVAELNSTSNETSTFLSADCLTTYFASNRGGSTQIYTATRTSVGSAWTAPTVLDTTFGTSTDNEDPWESTDHRAFFFATVRAPDTNKAVWTSTR